MKVIGIVPARMASSRLPGKPLIKIHGKPMIEHVYKRALLFEGWDHLALSTCDNDIKEFGLSKGWNVVMTSDQHTRCLDRVAEAAPILVPDIDDNDIVVCVQGDEPMLYPGMIEAVIKPMIKDSSVNCTVLGMDIMDEVDWRHRDVVKIVHDLKGDVLYTSRSPIPHSDEFSHTIGAKRIYGIFGFRWHFLKTFTQLDESPLEIVEACDSNRMFDYGFKQRMAPYPYKESYSVDNAEDLTKVENALKNDTLFGKY
jgi:3-deoxy-manno-octulosonate cytidylyltransferase (CMP-KDO synthetase)